MTDRKALEALIEKVEAGKIWRDHGILASYLDKFMPVSGYRVHKKFLAAFDGSLDASKALHEAVLHECVWATIKFAKRYENESEVEISHLTGRWRGHSVNPARAWLLAILRALLEQERGE